jgi:hypothetical protein
MGEARRRREAAGDDGFFEYRNHFKSHFPKASDRDIGEGWMRQYSANVDYCTPEDFRAPAGAVAVHVIFGEGAINAAIWPKDIDEAVARWAKAGVSRQQTKDEIMSAMVGNQHMQDAMGGAIICAALWLACNGEGAEAVRQRLHEADASMTYFVIDTGRRHPVDGRKEYVFRLMLQ